MAQPIDVAFAVLKMPPPQMRFDEEDLANLGSSMRVPTLNRIMEQDPALNIEDVNTLGFREEGPRGGDTTRPYVEMTTGTPLSSEALAQGREAGFTFLTQRPIPGQDYRNYKIKPKSRELEHGEDDPDKWDSQSDWGIGSHRPVPEWSELEWDERERLLGTPSEEEQAGGEAYRQSMRAYENEQSAMLQRLQEEQRIADEEQRIADEEALVSQRKENIKNLGEEDKRRAQANKLERERRGPARGRPRGRRW